MRNPNGYGTVYCLPGNRRRPWVARITTKWEWDKDKQRHVQKYQIIGYFEERPDAMAALAMHRINPVPLKASITLKELYEEWSKGAYRDLTRQTQDNYRAAWKRLKKFGNVKVKEIRTAHFQQVIDSCHAEELSRSSLEKIRIVSVSLMDYAMQNDIVNKNYAKFLRLPKGNDEERNRFSDIEIKKITEVKDEWTSTVLILIYSGMRIAELLTLTRFNVDFEKGIITAGVKTKAGKNRAIPISPKITKHLKYWHDKNGDTVICDENGKPISAKVFRKKYYAVLEKAEARRLTPHECRHTCASLLAAAGVPPIVIQRILGHKHYSTTADTYTHLEIEPLKDAIAKI